MTHFLLLNILIELTKNYGSVAKEFFILEKNKSLTLLFILHKCFAPAKADTRKKSDSFLCSVQVSKGVKD